MWKRPICGSRSDHCSRSAIIGYLFLHTKKSNDKKIDHEYDQKLRYVVFFIYPNFYKKVLTRNCTVNSKNCLQVQPVAWIESKETLVICSFSCFTLFWVWFLLLLKSHKIDQFYFQRIFAKFPEKIKILATSLI